MISLLPLALQAMEDDDACKVFGDAVLEAGWHDSRVIGFMWRTSWGDRYRGSNVETMIELAAHPDRHFAHACAAVLMCAGWPTSWELAMRCVVSEFDGNIAEFFAARTYLNDATFGNAMVYVARNGPVRIQPPTKGR